MSLLFEHKLRNGFFRAFDEKPAGPLLHVHQTHSARVVDVSCENLEQQEADGITASASTTLAIKTADCLPVFFGGPQDVALVHAGWRGLAAGILRDPAIGAIRPREIFIGPSIRACCFEVTSEFADHFPKGQLIPRPEGKWHFDLIAEAHRQLREQYPEAQVSDSGICTCCNKTFPSFRRDKTTQRIWNLFVPLAQ